MTAITTAFDLETQYGHWGEHPEYLVLHWADECKCNETRMAYWEWVSNKIANEDPPTPQTGPRCGHSACSQSYIDTGDAACVAPLWTVTANGYRVATVRAETDDEAQDLALSGFDADGDEIEWEDETTDVTVESVDD